MPVGLQESFLRRNTASFNTGTMQHRVTGLLRAEFCTCTAPKFHSGAIIECEAVLQEAFDWVQSHSRLLAYGTRLERPVHEQWLQSFTIITTKPNELTATVHNRMPVILHREDYDEWLMRVDGEDPPASLLRPYPAGEMKAKEAHKDVGNVRNNHPELLNSA
jgi:hypothetical protein